MTCNVTGWFLATNSAGLLAVCRAISAEPMTTNILESLTKILVFHLAADEARISENARFVDDLGADSLDVIEVAMSIEEAFNIRVPDWEADQFVTVGDAIEFIQRQLKRPH
jgi:acyl carrier protein